ncbi:MAG: hypothetical protein U1U88_000826 [Lawsonella clevelandensis]
MAEDTQVSGIDLGDAALAARTTRGMQQVEDLMFSSLDNGHAMPTLTASYLAQAGKRSAPLRCCWPRRSPLQRILPQVLQKSSPPTLFAPAP